MNVVDPGALPDPQQGGPGAAEEERAAERRGMRAGPGRAGEAGAEPAEPDGEAPPGAERDGERGGERRSQSLVRRVQDEAVFAPRPAERRTGDMRIVLTERSAPPTPAALAPSAEAAPFAWLPFLIFFLRRRWRVMAGATAGCAALALLYALTATPQFTAATQLMIDIRRADLLSQQHEVQDAQTLNSELESRVEILRSEGLARNVVERLNLQRVFGSGGGGFSPIGWLRGLLRPAHVAHTADRAADRGTLQLMRMTSVRRIGLTYVIEIAVTSASPMQAAQLANAFVETYITGQLSAQDQVTRQAGQWLQQRLQELRDQAMAAGDAVERYKADKHIVGTDKGLLNEQQLTELNSQIGSARQRSSAAKALAERTRTLLGGDVLNAALLSGLQSPIITTLRTEYLEDQQRAARWGSAYGANNAQVVKLRGEMAQLEVAIRSELQRIASVYQNEYDVARADEAALQTRLDALVASTVKTNSDRVKLSSLQSSAQTYRSVYENFLNRYTQAVQDESFPVSEARVITVAQPPLRKSAPHTTVLLAMGALLGMAGGFVFAFTREMLDRRLRTDAQLRTATGLACIGHLPRVRPAGAARGRGASASTALSLRPAGAGILRSAVDDPHSEFVQALRALRVRLMRASGFRHEIRLIGFVPAARGDGSTTAAVNFAQVLAASGCRAMLVDLDTEDDGLSRALAPDAAGGLLEAMSDPELLEALIWRDERSGVDVLPLGGRGLHGPLRFSPGGAQRVFDALVAAYDYVVVDLPPLSPAVESHILGNLLDAFVLVVDWGGVQHDRVAEGMRNTGLDQAKFVGAVYNRVDAKERGAYPLGGTGPAWAG